MFYSSHIKLYELPEHPCLLVVNRVSISLLHAMDHHYDQVARICWLAEREAMPSEDITDYLSRRQAAGILFSSTDDKPETVRAQIVSYLEQGYLVAYLPSTPSLEEEVPDHLTDISAEMMAYFHDLDIAIYPLYLGLYRYDEQQLLATRLPCDHVIGLGMPLLPAGEGMPQRLRQSWQEASVLQLDALHQLERPGISELILESLLQHSEASLIDGVNDSLLSYDELLSLLLPLARQLRKTHSECHRLGIILPPGRDAILANLACLITGIVPVNIDTTLPRAQVEKLVKQAELTRYITEERYYQKPSHFAWPLERDLIMLGKEIEHFGSFRRKVWGTTAHLADVEWLQKRLICLTRSADDAVMIFYSCDEQLQIREHTITHRMLLASRYITQTRLPLRAGNTVLSTQPYYEPMGLIMGMLYPLLCGCDIVTYPIASALPRLMTLAEQYRVDIALTNLAQLRRMQEEKPASPATAGQGVTFICYGDRLPHELQAHYEQQWGIRFLQAYYLPEAACFLSLESYPRSVHEKDEIHASTVDNGAGSLQARTNHFNAHVVSVNGQPLLGTTLRICDPEDEEPTPLSPHELGMLWVRSSCLISQDTWLRTGNIAFINERGELCIAGPEHRFSKLQNQLVPHEVIEELLYQIFEIPLRLPRHFVIISIRTGDDIAEKLVLVSTIHETIPTHELITLRYKLMNLGYPACWCPSHIVNIKQMPEQHGGELDYRRVFQHVCEQLEMSL